MEIGLLESGSDESGCYKQTFSKQQIHILKKCPWKKYCKKLKKIASTYSSAPRTDRDITKIMYFILFLLQEDRIKFSKDTLCLFLLNLFTGGRGWYRWWSCQPTVELAAVSLENIFHKPIVGWPLHLGVLNLQSRY